MTIEQLQVYYEISQNSRELDIDRSIRLICAFTGLKPEQVDNMSMRRFNRICRQMSKSFDKLGVEYKKGKPAKLVTVNGQTYRINYEVKPERVEAPTFKNQVEFEQQLIKMLHKTIASIAIPVRWSWRHFKWVGYEMPVAKIAEDFKKLDAKIAYQVAIFFYMHYCVSFRLLKPYMVDKLVKSGGNREEITMTLDNAENVLYGITVPDWANEIREYGVNRFSNN